MAEGSDFATYVGLTVTPGEEGRAEARLEARDDHLNRNGTVHGGALATLADTAMGAAVSSLAADGKRPVTVEMTLTYLEPGRPGLLVARARTRKPGRRLTIVEAEVTQGEDGEVLVHTMATFTTVG